MTTLAHELGLIPPARLGPLASQARQAWGWSLADVARRTDGLLSTVELRLLESGRLAASDIQVRALFGVLSISTEELLPVRVRLEVDTSQGRLVAGGSVAQVLPDATEDELLRRYLCLVYTLRRIRAGTFVVPRTDDLGVLATALDRSAADIRLSLEHLMRHRRDDLRLGVRALIGRAALPGLGLLVGMTSLGALLLVEAQPLSAAPVGPGISMSAPSSLAPAFLPAPGAGRVDIGVPLVLERLTSSAIESDRAGDLDDVRAEPGVVLSMVRTVPDGDRTK